MGLSLCINSLAAENGEIINNEKINQMLEIDNFKKTDKEQEILNLYKERLNLLSYKERQLKVYENSLKGLKAEIDLMQSDIEVKQSSLNTKEIALLKKELQLKEKERDLAQLEEKLSQIDNVQLTRESVKPSNPSVTLKTDLRLDANYSNTEVNSNNKLDTNKTEVITVIPEKTSIKKENKKESKTTRTKAEKTKIKNMPYITSGLGQMKKDILNEGQFKEK